MANLIKPLSNLFLAGVLVFSIATTADAQRGGRGGGGFRGGFGGGARFGGGGFRGGYGGGYRGGSHIGVGIGIGIGGFGGYYNSFGYPRYGLFGALPLGYYPFFWGADQYYYAGGVFYQPGANGGYQVATPPVGAEIPSLPKGVRPISIDGNQYYEFNGVYYKDAVTPDGKKVYVVAGKDGVLNTGNDTNPGSTATVDPSNPPMPQVGDMTDQLPEGARKVTLNHKKYWVTTDNIYLEEVQNGDRTSYRVVSVPDNNPDEKSGQ